MTIKERRIAEQEKVIARNRELMADRQRRISNNETDMEDCFASHLMEKLSVQVAKRKIDILENGGTSEFEVLKDMETGEIVSTECVRTRYGRAWIIRPEFRHKFKKFINDAKRDSTYHKKGLDRTRAKLPAWVTTRASGSGMADVYMLHVTTFISDKNYATEE